MEIEEIMKSIQFARDNFSPDDWKNQILSDDLQKSGVINLKDKLAVVDVKIKQLQNLKELIEKKITEIDEKSKCSNLAQTLKFTINNFERIDTLKYTSKLVNTESNTFEISVLIADIPTDKIRCLAGTNCISLLVSISGCIRGCTVFYSSEGDDLGNVIGQCRIKM